MRTIIINLYGGPGCGKSTLASELFYKMKRAGKSVELVREYAKEWAYQNKEIDTIVKQTYILAKQAKRETSLYGKVRYIITDCPLHLSGFYAQYYLNTDIMKNLVDLFIKESCNNYGVIHTYFQVPRKKAYDKRGRYQTEEESIAIDVLQAEYFENITLKQKQSEYLTMAESIIEKLKGIESLLKKNGN